MLCCITFLFTSFITNAAEETPIFQNYVGFNIGAEGDGKHYYLMFSPLNSSSSENTGYFRMNDYAGITDFSVGGNFHFSDDTKFFTTSNYFRLFCNFGVVSQYNGSPTNARYNSVEVINSYVTIDGVDFPCKVLTNFESGSGVYDTNYTCVCYINRFQFYQLYYNSSNFSNLPFTLHGSVRFASNDEQAQFNNATLAQLRLYYRIQAQAISESYYVNGRSQIVRDVNGNSIAQQGNTIAQQGNDIAQQGNDIAEQGNDIAQENADTNKDTNNKITSFFNSFFDNLIGVFVPESGFFSQWFSSLNDFMAQKLGFLWSPFDFLISFLNGVYSGSGSASIVFPELAWIDGTVIIPRTEFSFDNIGGQSFSDLRDMIYFATDVILLGAVISQFYKKIKLVFEGGGD